MPPYPPLTCGHAAEDTVGQQFSAALDPSDCEAFASPTAYYCVRFDDDEHGSAREHFREFIQTLKEFKVKVRTLIALFSTVAAGTTLLVAVQRYARRKRRKRG